MQGGICQLCLQPCYRAYEDSWDTTSNPMMAHRAIVHTHTLLTNLFWVILSSLCVGCSSVLSGVLLFLQNPAMHGVTLAAANRDPNKYG